MSIRMVFLVLLAGACGSQVPTQKTQESEISREEPTVLSVTYTQDSTQKRIAQTVTFREQKFDTYTISYPDSNLAFYLNDASGKKIGSLGNLKDLLASQGKKLLFATNGGMYMKNQEPQGLFIRKGKQKRRLDTNSGNGNFHLKPNGVFFITKDSARVLATDHFLKTQLTKSKLIASLKKEGVYATQSGPMLVIDGKLHPAFREGSKNVHYRNGVGILPDGSIVFAISQQKVNFYDFASLFQDHFQCRNALYLDGFVSKMYLPELGRQDQSGNFGVIIGLSQ